MADKPKDEPFVEYRVLKPVFVNDTYVDPQAENPLGAKRRKDGHVYVLAPRGLETKDVLELVRGGKAAQPDPQGTGTGAPQNPNPQGEGSGGSTGK